MIDIHMVYIYDIYKTIELNEDRTESVARLCLC